MITFESYHICIMLYYFEIMKIKKPFRIIHLWLGLLSGIVIVLVCLSGAFIAFTEEALSFVNRDYLYVANQATPKAKIDNVIKNYQSQYPKEKLFLINAYRQENRTYDFFSAIQKEDKSFGGYKMVYADPYSGKIIRIDKGTLELIVSLVFCHTSLFLGEVGEYIIQFATLFFLIQIISGLVLWYPTTRNALKSVFKIKTDSSKKRLNYDLHRIPAFYASLALLVLVCTGLFMAWDFVKYPVTDLVGGNSNYLEEKIQMPKRELNKADISFDYLFDKLKKQRPEANQFTFFMPDSDTATVLQGKTHANISFLNFEVGELFQFNRYNGHEAGGDEIKYIHKNNRILSMVLFIHMGFWGGLPTKIITFIVGLIGASLPVTGFFIWWGRKRKKCI